MVGKGRLEKALKVLPQDYQHRLQKASNEPDKTDGSEHYTEVQAEHGFRTVEDFHGSQGWPSAESYVHTT